MNFFTSLFRKGTLKVVIVEDDAPLRQFIAEQLNKRGVQVVETGDGAVATQIIAEQQPGCVVLDVMLPGKNGMQILAELRAVDTQTPVVVLTTLSGEGGLRLEAEKHNATFLNKADTSLESVVETVMKKLEQ
jgi:DNA-binding response OmpR family regulator